MNTDAERRQAFAAWLARRKLALEVARGRRYKDFELAELLQVSGATFSDYQKSKTMPSANDQVMIARLAEVFADEEVYDFFGLVRPSLQKFNEAIAALRTHDPKRAQELIDELFEKAKKRARGNPKQAELMPT